MTEKRDLINSLAEPIDLFKLWFEEASQNEINDPNAMNLSTISNDLKPNSRMVLLKNFNKKGFVFYSNLTSKKGLAILNNPNVALNFHWKSVLKQVRIEGKIHKISEKESDEYFQSRDEESKIGAWASKQSSVLSNRQILEENISYYKKKFKDKLITRPTYWAGFRVMPNLIEFWKDMPFRLHDRLEYRREDNNKWVFNRLYP